MKIWCKEDNRIVNFDNVITIGLEAAFGSKSIVAYLDNGRYVPIGEYETKERAEKVLAEIFTCTSNRYIMPKE